MRVNLPLAGSYMETWRPEFSSGNAFADGCVDPALQKSGLRWGRMRAVNQMWPFSSIIGLCMMVWLSQIGLSPQTAEGAKRAFFVFGVLGLRTGCFTSLAVAVFGSRMGTKSVLFSGEP